MITSIRSCSQQLVSPKFNTPKEVVSWMGAMQAQEYNMAKWAIGIRLPSSIINTINEALEKGEILRTHILRPTWHYVAAEDIRWMLKLSGKRIQAANDSWWGKGAKMAKEEYNKYNRLLEKILEGKSLSKQEVAEELGKLGKEKDPAFANRILMNAEAEGIVCSGVEKKGKHTFALLEERAAPVKDISKEEALAKIATKYFQSHSPASMQDFLWWSGLLISEAKLAINLIKEDLTTEKRGEEEIYIHTSCEWELAIENEVHLLPSYDEYLISYKNRTAALALEHHPKAFTNYGIFYPVILYNGIVVGNWKKQSSKKEISIETIFFDKKIKIDKKLIEQAKKRYIEFIT